MKKCKKKIKTKEKRLTLKERRLEKVKSNKFIGIFTGLLISYWTLLFLTLDKIISQKNIFSQEILILMLSGIFVCMFYGQYNHYIKTKTDIKNIIYGIKINLRVSFYFVVIALVIEKMFS